MRIENVTVDKSYVIMRIENVTVDKSYVIMRIENVTVDKSYVRMCRFLPKTVANIEPSPICVDICDSSTV